MRKFLYLMLVGALSFTMVGCADEILEETPVAEETVSETVEETVEEGLCPYEDAPLLTFATEEIDGHAISTEDLAEANLVMVNFWEPWCGPWECRWWSWCKRQCRLPQTPRSRRSCRCPE